MEIKHNKEHYHRLINKMEDVHFNIEYLTPKIARISEKLKKMNLGGSSRVVENAIDDLEEKLLYDFNRSYRQFIDITKEGNKMFIEKDEEIAKKLEVIVEGSELKQFTRKEETLYQFTREEEPLQRFTREGQENKTEVSFNEPNEIHGEAVRENIGDIKVGKTGEKKNWEEY